MGEKYIPENLKVFCPRVTTSFRSEAYDSGSLFFYDIHVTTYVSNSVTSPQSASYCVGFMHTGRDSAVSFLPSSPSVSSSSFFFVS